VDDDARGGNIPNNAVSNSSFWNFLGFLIYLAAVCFGSFDIAQDRFWYSDFEFCLARPLQ
jgi:hypothetical protein